MELVTGRAGTPHITSQQDRQRNQGTFGNGAYILKTGNQLAPVVQSSNKIQIKDGALMFQGALFSVKVGTVDEVTIANGSQGMQRKDLIVARYTYDAGENVESAAWAVIQGTQAASNPVTPEYTEGDIQAGDTTVECPVFIVTLDGINITGVEMVPEIAPDVPEIMAQLEELNSKIGVLQDTDSTIESAIASNGRALKIYDATENVTYGCWGEGIYTVKPYVPGSPSNWGGMCLVTHIRDSNGAFDSYVKTFFSSDCKVYIMRQDKDGTVEQNWTAQS